MKEVKVRLVELGDGDAFPQSFKSVFVGKVGTFEQQYEGDGWVGGIFTFEEEIDYWHRDVCFHNIHIEPVKES